MRGLLADVNLQGHMPWLQYRLESIDLWSILVAEDIRFETFRDHGISPRLDDRSLWRFCQATGEEMMRFPAWLAERKLEEACESAESSRNPDRMPSFREWLIEQELIQVTSSWMRG